MLFISYSTKYRAIATKVYERLVGRGFCLPESGLPSGFGHSRRFEVGGQVIRNASLSIISSMKEMYRRGPVSGLQEHAKACRRRQYLQIFDPLSNLLRETPAFEPDRIPEIAASKNPFPPIWAISLDVFCELFQKGSGNGLYGKPNRNASSGLKSRRAIERNRSASFGIERVVE